MAIRPTGSYVTKKKTSKKGKAQKRENRFYKKKFFNLTSHTPFPTTLHGQTCNVKLRSKQDMVSALVGRTFSVNQGDLANDNKDTHRNFCFKVGDVRGSDCLSFFNGMYLARDKMAGMVRKWHTLVEADVDVTTKDGSVWRFFSSLVTRKRVGQTSKTTYLGSSEERTVRKIMVDTIKAEVEGQDVDRVIKKLSTESIGKLIESRCAEIANVSAVIRKVKPLKNTKIIDLTAGNVVNRGEERNTIEILTEN
ncbi:small subunit ribosomal protein S3Ae [Pancytospora epiphaga]|nr:small subunit ribosomal protein S3Ae [Pancytospora epiphaga]